MTDLSRPWGAALDAEQTARRREMVERQIRRRGIRDARVLAAMLAVPRHAFVAPEWIEEAYTDRPVAIGADQTISQPFIVASMTEALGLTGAERVLEIGTGSGYQTAVLSLLAAEVYTVESIASLGEAASQRLAQLGYRNVRFRIGDGTLGWPDASPFDAIVVTAASPRIPEPLAAQLAEAARMVLPIGSAESQEMSLVHRCGDEFTTRMLYPCRFVPLLGRFGWSLHAPGNAPEE
jgi:protein-L-isoaspartate(D-aspartate) O-methyltransferase